MSNKDFWFDYEINGDELIQISGDFKKLRISHDGGETFEKEVDAPQSPKAEPLAKDMTKREYIATAAMSGLLAVEINQEYKFEDIAEWSVKCADALLAKLEDTGEER